MIPQRRDQPIDPRKALVVAVVCWIGFALVVAALRAGRADALDELGLLFWRAKDLTPRGPAWLLEAVRDVTALGGVVLRNLFALFAAVALVFIGLRREAVLLIMTVASGWLVNSLVKLAVGRPRPQIVPHLTEAGGASFPSGHSFNSAVVYLAIALAFAAMSTRDVVRTTIIAAAVIGTLTIALSRVWLGVHFPTDVIAGWLGGAGWAFLAAALLARPAAKASAALPDT